MSPSARTRPARTPPPGAHVAILGLLALSMLVPVTLPVAVLRDLVQQRFGVSEFLTSLFMSVNMVGALLAAPLAGILADRGGYRRGWIAAALLCDSALFWALTLPQSFPTFLVLRGLEGAAHIAALSLLLGLASGAGGSERRGRVMGLVGGGITLGVAIGAPLGGFLGAVDSMLPLYVGSAVSAGAALLAWFGLREAGGRGRRERPTFRRIVADLRGHPLLLAPLAFAFADRFTVGFYTTTFSLFLSRIHELSPPGIGALLALFLLPFAALSYPFGRLAEKRSRVAMIAAGSAVYGVATVLVPWCGVGVLVPLMLLLGVASAVMFVPSLLITADAAPETVRTTALGAFNAAGSLGFLVGPATGGLVSQLVASHSGWEVGYRATFAVAGASELLCVALGLPFLLRLVRRGHTT